jgi:hypothetical protein
VTLPSAVFSSYSKARSEPLRYAEEKGGWVIKLLHTKTLRLEQTTERAQHGSVVVKEPDGIAAIDS